MGRKAQETYNSKGVKDMYIVDFIVAFIFLILGVILYLGKASFLIAGYNTLGSKKKAKIDEQALCRFIGKVMFVWAFSIFLWGLSGLIKQPILYTIGLVVFIATAIFSVVYANTKNRFLKKDKGRKSKKRRR